MQGNGEGRSRDGGGTALELTASGYNQADMGAITGLAAGIQKTLLGDGCPLSHVSACNHLFYLPTYRYCLPHLPHLERNAPHLLH